MATILQPITEIAQLSESDAEDSFSEDQYAHTHAEGDHDGTNSSSNNPTDPSQLVVRMTLQHPSPPPNVQQGAFLSTVPLLHALTRAECDILGALMVEQHWPTGSAIIKQGEKGHGLFILKSGHAQITQQQSTGISILGTGKSEPMLLDVLSSRDHFGEGALIRHPNLTGSSLSNTPNIRGATVIASSPCTTLFLSTNIYFSLYPDGISPITFAQRTNTTNTTKGIIGAMPGFIAPSKNALAPTLSERMQTCTELRPPRVPDRYKDTATLSLLNDALNTHNFFVGMDNTHRVALVDTMWRVTVPKGTTLIVQGQVGHNSYVVASGKLGVYINQSISAEIKHYIDNNKTLRLDNISSTTTHHHYTDNNNNNTSAVGNNPDNNTTTTTTSSSLSSSKDKEKNKDTTSLASASAALSSASSSASAPPLNKEVKVDTIIKPGSLFGELSLLNNSPRTATVITKSKCTLWVLDRLSYRRVMRNITEEKIIQYSNFLSKVSLFQSLTNSERMKVAEALEEERFCDQDIVIEGDLGDCMYIVVDGVLQVSKHKQDNDHPIQQQQSSSSSSSYILAKLTQGQFFGEASLLNPSTPRSATVTAIGRVLLAKIDLYTFTMLLGPVISTLKSARKIAQHRDNQVAEQKRNLVEFTGTELSKIGAKKPIRAGEAHDLLLEDLDPVLYLGHSSVSYVELVKHRKTKELYALRTVFRTPLLLSGQWAGQKGILSSPLETMPSSLSSLSSSQQHQQQSSSSSPHHSVTSITSQPSVSNNIPLPYQYILHAKEMMITFNSPSFITLYATYKDSTRLCMLTEACLGGTLYNVLQQRSALDENTVRFYLAGVILGLEQIHSKGYVYRNIKPENILLDSRGYPKISHLGTCKNLTINPSNNTNPHNNPENTTHDTCKDDLSSSSSSSSLSVVCPEHHSTTTKLHRTYSIVGSPHYMPPEMIRCSGHDTTADLWSLGVLAYELLAGRPPFYRPPQERRRRNHPTHDHDYNDGTTINTTQKPIGLQQHQSASASQLFQSSSPALNGSGGNSNSNSTGGILPSKHPYSTLSVNIDNTLAPPLSSSSSSSTTAPTTTTLPSKRTAHHNRTASLTMMGSSHPHPRSPSNRLVHSLSGSSSTTGQLGGPRRPSLGLVQSGSSASLNAPYPTSNYPLSDTDDGLTGLFSRIVYGDILPSPLFSTVAWDLISKLIVIKPRRRLGAGFRGLNDIKEHPFFDNFNWNDFSARRLASPYLPTLNKTDQPSKHTRRTEYFPRGHDLIPPTDNSRWDDEF